jgi:hypothetical protein
VVAARAAVKLVRERVDSPRETWLRLCLVLAGLPEPECNLIIGNDHGPMGRVDLVYLAFRLIIEYEGDQHRTDRNQWNHDIDRHEDFTRDHWTLIRVTSERARWRPSSGPGRLPCPHSQRIPGAAAPLRPTLEQPL